MLRLIPPVAAAWDPQDLPIKNSQKAASIPSVRFYKLVKLFRTRSVRLGRLSSDVVLTAIPGLG